MQKVDPTIYEVEKTLEVTPMMQLVDLNGTRVNFQSDFTVTVNDPTKQILVAIVNQNQLDNGDINFEETISGKCAKRVTYQNVDHLNHYIALKKLDRDEIPIECSVIVKLKELLPLPAKTSLPEQITPSLRSDLHTKLEKLKNDTSYNSLPKESTLRNKTNFENKTEKYDMIKPREIPDKNMRNKDMTYMTSSMTLKDKLRYDPYYTVSFVCFTLFLLILFLKFIKK